MARCVVANTRLSIRSLDMRYEDGRPVVHHLTPYPPAENSADLHQSQEPIPGTDPAKSGGVQTLRT